MRQVAMHAMDYIDAATTGILSLHVLPVEYLWKMSIHIEEALPSTMHLPVSSEDTLHFYRYLHTHVFIADKVSPTHWCTHTGSHTVTQNIWSLQFSYTSQRLICRLQYRQQVFRHNL